MSTVTISAAESAALAALARRVDGIPAEFDDRIADHVNDLATVHEAFRHSGPPQDFARRAAALATRRNRAEARRACLEPACAAPARQEIAAEVLGLMLAARMRASEVTSWLRAERLRLLANAAAELAELDARAKSFADGHRVTVMAASSEELDAGEHTQLEVRLRRLVPILERQQVLEARVKALNAGGDYRTAVAKAIDAAGGPDKVVALVVKRMAGGQSPPEVAAAEAAVKAIDDRLAGIDPDSELAAGISATRPAAVAAIPAAREAAARRISATAEALVAATLAGNAARAGDLERLAPPELAAALAEARGTGDQLVATLAAWIEDDAESRKPVNRHGQ